MIEYIQEVSNRTQVAVKNDDIGELKKIESELLEDSELITLLGDDGIEFFYSLLTSDQLIQLGL